MVAKDDKGAKKESEIYSFTYNIIQWKKTFGGFGNDYARSIQQTTDGGYIVAGYTDSNDGDVSYNHGGDDIWIIKLDENGNLEWEKSLGGSSRDEAHSIQKTTDGGYIVAGVTMSNDGDVSNKLGNDGDYWIIKFKIEE